MIRILYVDDEPDLLEIGKKFLERNQEFRVDTTVMAKIALEILNKTKYDAVISDYQMPGMDGIALLKEIRLRFGDLPFILFTGRGREEIAVEALNNGADFYLQKGGDSKAQFTELSHKLLQAVNKHNAERALAESESRFRDLTENSLDTIMLFDRDLRHLYVNHNAEVQTGIPASQFIGKTHKDLGFPQDLINIWEKTLHEVFESGRTDRIEFQIPSGSWIDWMVVPVKSEDGTVLQVITSARDITERRNAEERIRLAEFSLEHSGIATFWLDEDARVIRANLAASEALGYTQEEFSNIKVHDFDPLYDPSAWKDIWQQLAEKKYLVIESLHKRKDGSIFPVEIASSYFEYSGKKLIFSFAKDISGRKKAETEIKAAYEQIATSEEELKSNYENLARSQQLTSESEALFRGLFDQAFQLTCLLDLKGNLTRVNKTAISFIGKDIEEVINRPFPQTPWWIKNQEGQDKIRDSISRANRGESSRFETTHEDSNGYIHYIDFSLKPVFDDKGAIIALLSEGRDITDRKRAEEALIKSERNLKKISDTVPGALFQFYARKNGDMGLYYVSERSEELFGISGDPKTFFPRFTAGIAPEDKEAFFNSIQHSIKSEEKWEFKGKFYKSTGEEIYFHAISLPDITDDELIFYGVIFDITSQEMTEKARIASEEQYRSLVETTGTGYVIVDLEGRVIDANQEYIRLTGRKKLSEIKGKPVTDWTAPYDLKRNAKEIEKCIRKGEVRGLEIDYRKPDGSFQPIEVNASLFNSDSGVIILTLCRDITERRRSENALKEEQKFTRLLLDTIPTFFVAINAEGRVLTMNKALINLLEYSIDEVKGKDYLSSFVPKEDKDLLADIFKEIVYDEKATVNKNHVISKSGKVYLIEWYGRLVKHEDKNLDFFVGVGIDITDKDNKTNTRVQS